LGRAAMDELETVSLEQTDAGSEITKATEAGGIVFVTLAEAGSIDAETAAEHADLFAEWAFPVGYTVGQIRRYNGTLYKCVQAHTSQADRTRLPACGAKRVIPLKNGPNGANRWERMTLIPRGQR